MAESYCKERLLLLDRLLKEPDTVASGRLWTLEPKNLRFRYGESIAELKIPYHLGAEDETCIEEAVTGLAGLLKERFEEAAEAAPYKGGNARGGLREKTYRTDVLLADSLESKVAKQVLGTTPLLDTAVLASWLAPGGPGKRFLQWTTDMVEKALTDEAKHEDGERTSYLALLAMIKSLNDKKKKMRDLRIRGVTYEKLDFAIGLTLFAAVRAVLGELFERLKAQEANYYRKEAELTVKTALVPRAFLAIPSTLLSGSLNPYGINADIFQALSTRLPKVEDIDTNVEELVKDSIKIIKYENTLVEAMVEQYRVIKLREYIINYLMDFDIPGHKAHRLLYDLYEEDRNLTAYLKEPKKMEGLRAAFDEARKNFARDRKRAEAVERLGEELKGFKKRGWLAKGRDETASALYTVVLGFYAACFDEHVDKYAGLMRVYLTDRRAEFDDKTLFDEYQRGRLYRFSLDARPILATLTRGEEGQLFVDMKDFTKKTLKVKEIAMAEFLKENFYSPILDAASRYGAGMGLLADERGIRLNSFPGDAAIFSGGVANLVALAHDIGKIIRQYREKLLKRLPPVKEELLPEEVHRDFASRKEELRKSRAALEKAIARGDEDARTKLLRLVDEEQRIEKSFRKKLEAAIATEIDAGLFISYGVKAETLIIDGKEDFTEPMKVAIGEKINEAARGAYRHPMVRAKLEMLLENERHKRNNMELQYPFDIYIDRTYSVRMTPELDKAIESLVAGKTVADEKAIAQEVAKRYYNDLRNLKKGQPLTSLRLLSSSTDIYNRGRAITKQALEAYIRETRGKRFFFKKDTKVSELKSSIREMFFFPREELELWFGVEVKEGMEFIEGFVGSGEIAFRGFESKPPIVVYEMLDNEEPFFRALREHHFRVWLEDAKKAQR